MSLGAGKPGPTACKTAARSYLNRLHPLIALFQEQGELARATPRIGLSQRVADMQATKRKIAALRPPKCLEVAHFLVTDALERETNAMVTFMANGETFGVQQDFKAVEEGWELSRIALREAVDGKRGKPTPVALADVCCRCGVPIADGDWTMHLDCGTAHAVCPRDRTPTPTPIQ